MRRGWLATLWPVALMLPLSAAGPWPRTAVRCRRAPVSASPCRRAGSSLYALAWGSPAERAECGLSAQASATVSGNALRRAL
jgi:hypothetical protein